MIVVDGSVAVKLVTKENGSSTAWERVLRDPERVAPAWVMAEVSSALAKKVRFSGLPLATALEAVAALSAFTFDLADFEPLLPQAMALSQQLNHPFYDCVYLALAIERGAVMLTADGKFTKAASAFGFADRVELLAA